MGSLVTDVTRTGRFKSGFRERMQAFLAEARALKADFPHREFLVTIAKNLWPAYLLASTLILWGFTWGLPNHYQDKSFQADENAAVWAVNQIRFPLHMNPRWFNWGTGLFYQTYLVKLVFTAGGLAHASDYWMLVMGRLVVFVSALGAITALFLLGRKLFDGWIGRLAATILAVLPGFVINGHYFKTDVPMTFWMLTTMLVAYQLVENGASRYVFLLGLLVGYTASVKYPGGLMLLAGLVAIAMASRKFHKRFSWLTYFVCVALGFAFGEPAALLPAGWGAIIKALRWVGSLNRLGIPYHVARPPAWIDYPLNVMPFSMTAPMLMAAAVALAWAVGVCVLTGKRWALLPILTFMVAYYPVLATDNWRLVRYTVPLLPFAALFVALFVGTLRDRPIVGRVAVVTVCALMAYAFLSSLSYVRAFGETDPRIQASRWVEDQIPRGQSVPEIATHYLNLPQLGLVGYKTVFIDYSISDLRSAPSPYLIVSEFSTSPYSQAIDYYPQQRRFFQFVTANYVEVIHFENSQKLLFIDSKRRSRLPQDWLHPNPRITIMLRRPS